LRRYDQAAAPDLTNSMSVLGVKQSYADMGGGGLHSFPFPLNLSLLCPFPLNLSLLVPIYPKLIRGCVSEVLKLSSNVSDVSQRSSSSALK